MSRWGNAALGLLAVAVVALWGVTWYHVARPVPASAQPVALPSATPTGPSYPARRYRLNLPAHPNVVFLGDSWTVGYAATPGNGYAYVASRRLGWHLSIVPNGTGTGYLNRGPEKAGTYLQRVSRQPVDRAVDLVVIQGGLNDAFLDTSHIDSAAAKTIAAVRSHYPNAQLLMIGPLAPTDAAEPGVWEVENSLEYVAARQRVDYISPVMEGWFTVSQRGRFIDHAKGDHPNTAGHRYLAQRFIQDVRALAR